jgi:hypothetical protein
MTAAQFTSTTAAAAARVDCTGAAIAVEHAPASHASASAKCSHPSHMMME